MSDQFHQFTSPIKKEIILEIEGYDLPLFQKHHLRLMLHCLEIFKEIAYKNNDSFPEISSLKKWSTSQAEKINDGNFSNLLFEQMFMVAKKLNAYSEKINKKVLDLEIEDLVNLIKESQ